MRKKIITIFFIFFVFLILSVCGFYFFNIQIKNAKDQGYKQGWDAAKARLNEQIGSMVSEGVISNKIIGVVQAVNNNEINLKINNGELLSDPELDNRKVLINGQTKILQFQLKSDEKYAQELEKYYQEKNIDLKTFVPDPNESFGPERYEQVLVDVSAVKVGKTIDVYADGDIKNVKNFIAKEIVVKN